ncbi:MAG TPA: NCS2 family permease [Bryobacteraceae bacterium]|jgi:AGZA family xanthine/uracil permease-like MFS transporter|nr:NCS2 family permease [Bryobacteraceae bacterium]
MRARLERFFEFERLGTSWRTEALAGLTTFVTMAYIIFVNPAILRDAGMPVAAVTAATCLCAGVATILMGITARYPIALAPGMGLNAYFAYTVVKGMGIPWQTALGAVFFSGVVFLLLTLAGLRQRIIRAIPASLYAAVATGIGLFIALIGLRNSGIIVPSPATMVALGNLRAPSALLALFGLALTAVLLARRVPAAMLLGIIGTSALAWATGQVHWQAAPAGIASLSQTAFKLDLRALFKLGLLEIVFVFVFVDLFDNLGTLIAVTRKAGLMTETGEIPRVGRILVTDAIATMLGGLIGTSTVTSYIESAAGIVTGGRSGVTAIVTGLLFLLSLFLVPVAGLIPEAATAPALILVGSLMMSHAAEVRWLEPEDAIPAFLTILTIPLTFSIATGLSFGFIAAALLRLIRGNLRRGDWLLYLLALLCLARFVYLNG